MVARVFWEDLVRVQISAPRLRVWCSSSTKPFQGLSTGAHPVTRSKIKTDVCVCSTSGFKPAYFAYSITLVSLMTLTFISPGYFSSS